MKAAVLNGADEPEVLKHGKRPIPRVEKGHVLIQTKAFGLNRSEMFTRRSHSPTDIRCILGIDATGVVEEVPGNRKQLE